MNSLGAELLEEGREEVDCLESFDMGSGSEFRVPNYLSALSSPLNRDW